MIEIEHNGRRFGEWTQATVSASLERGARSFSLSTKNGTTAFNFRDRVRVYVANLLQCTGYADTITRTDSATNERTSISGRSVTADLIDSHIVHRRTYTNASIAAIAKDVCLPFGVRVEAETGTAAFAPLATWHPKRGTKAFESIEKLARGKRLRVFDSADGALEIRQSLARDRVTWHAKGQYVESSIELDAKERFSLYTLANERVATDTDLSGEYATESDATATDEAFGRMRHLVIEAKRRGNAQWCKDRISHEATVRAGRSTRITYKVPTLLAPNGNLWNIGTVVDLHDSRLSATPVELIITDVVWSDSATQQSTSLTMRPVGMFDTEPKLVANKLNLGAWSLL